MTSPASRVELAPTVSLPLPTTLPPTQMQVAPPDCSVFTVRLPVPCAFRVLPASASLTLMSPQVAVMVTLHFARTLPTAMPPWLALRHALAPFNEPVPEETRPRHADVFARRHGAIQQHQADDDEHAAATGRRRRTSGSRWCPSA